MARAVLDSFGPIRATTGLLFLTVSLQEEDSRARSLAIRIAFETFPQQSRMS